MPDEANHAAASTTRKVRVMLDAGVLIAGSGWPRWPYELLLAGMRGEVQLVLTPYVLEQARRVLRMRFPQHLERFEQFLAHSPFELAADPNAEEVARHHELVRDVTDVPVALAAINARVDHLVSEDKDLTTEDASTEELRSYVSVLLPGTFLRQVLGWNTERLEGVRNRRWSDLGE